MKKVVIILAIIFSNLTMLSAQVNKEQLFKELKEFHKNEKLKIKLENAKEYLNKKSDFDKKYPNEQYPTIFLNGTGDQPIAQTPAPESEVYAAINPTDTNNIVLSPIQQLMSSNVAITCPIYYTKDFGTTWKRSNFLTAPKLDTFLLVGGGDPVFAFDPNGRLYMSWINLYITYQKYGETNFYYEMDSIFAALYYAYSDDGGENFTFDNSYFIGDKISGDEYSNNPGFELFLDKQWMASDYSNSQYRGNIYLSLVEIDMQQYDTEMKLFTKNDKDIKFNPKGVSINNDLGMTNQFGNVDVDNNGTVHSTFYAFDMGFTQAGSLFHATSTNGGKSFNQPNLISRFLGSHSQHSPEKITGISSSRLYPSPHLAIDKSNGANSGNLYFTWTASGTTSKTGRGIEIYFSKSTDNGLTWSEPINIGQNYNDNNKYIRFYSSITVNPDGKIAVAYYEQNTSITTKQTNYIVAVSDNGGNSFDRFIKASSNPSNFNVIGSQNGQFGIGEYNYILSTKAYVMPIYGDGRNNNGDVNIYFGKFDINSGATSVEPIVINDKNILNVYPNPSSDFIMIEKGTISSSINNVNIFDTNGNLVKRIENYSFNNKIDISKLPHGTYFVFLGNDYTKIIKE